MKTNNKSRFKLTVSIKSDFSIDILYYIQHIANQKYHTAADAKELFL